MKDPNIPPRLRPDEALRRQFALVEGLPFAELLSAEQFQRILEDCEVEFRERIFSPLVTVATFLSQVLDPDHSMRQAVARLIAYRASLQLPACSADTRAYSKARQRLPESVWAELARRTGRDLMLEAPARWCWRGHEVKIVDGTTLSMPDTPANQEAYPQSANQKPGLGFPLVRLVALFSLSVGSVLDIALGPHKGKQTSETILFHALHHHLEHDDVLLADRFFCGYFDIALVRQRSAHVVMRLHQRRLYDFRRGQRLGPDDHLVTWHKPTQRPDWLNEETYARLPATITMREVRIRVPAKTCRTRTIVVATTLLDAEAYPKECIAELYRQRWHAELDLRSLKTFMQMDILRCKSPTMVRKEIWVHVLAYNLIRQVMAQAAKEHDVTPRQLSFKGALQTLNAFSECLRACEPSDLAEVCGRLLAAIAQHRVGDRPDRVEPRARKRRAKSYPLLQQPRDKARKAELTGT